MWFKMCLSGDPVHVSMDAQAEDMKETANKV